MTADVIQFPNTRKDSDWFAGGTFLVADFVAMLRREVAVRLARDGNIAVYRDGIYRTGDLELRRVNTVALGNLWTRALDGEIAAFLEATLHAEGDYLPSRAREPLLCLRNGMLDLRTGILAPHGPEHNASVMLDLEWDADARAPLYTAWLHDTIPGQVDDLEESAAAMLDPSRTPTKALFLFGPSRSGKSTFLRIMEAVAGPENVSGVSLHQLSRDQFAAANLEGKMLNVSADLPSADIDDVSLFKMLTGEDVVQANRKYGRQFTFTNRALFAFSANELPSVGESSRAYSERIRPFHFARSFAGQENREIEVRMRRELPGILVRWVAAWQRREARGGRYVETDPAVRATFEEASDRVRRFARQVLLVGPECFATTTELHAAFKLWAQINGVHDLGRTRFAQRLAAVPGVNETRGEPSRQRGWTASVRHRDAWELA